MASRRLTPEEAAKRVNVAELTRRAQAAEAKLTAAEEREKTVAPGHAVLARAIADARQEEMRAKTRAQAAEADADRSKQVLEVVRTWAENVGGHTPPWYAQVCDVLDVVKAGRETR